MKYCSPLKDRMNARLLYILLLAFLTGYSEWSFAQAQTNDINPDGYNKFYFPGGKLQSEGTMKNGQPEGYWKTYYENGNMKSEGNRLNHSLDGDWKFYNENGIITTE